MNHRNRDSKMNWILCQSKSFPGKFYYFNVLTGEAAWTHSEMESAWAMHKNSCITKANRWHTFPEPSGPPDARDLPGPGWQRRPGQYLFSSPRMPVSSELTFPVYRSQYTALQIPNMLHNPTPIPGQYLFSTPRIPVSREATFPVYRPQYTAPKLPNMMHNPTPKGPVFMGENKRDPDIKNMWGYYRDPYSLNMDTTKRFVRWDKPHVFVNHSSAPIESPWNYEYQNIDATPIVGQNLLKAAPTMYEPRTEAKKEFTQWRTPSESSNFENKNHLLETKPNNNLRSLGDSAYFGQTSFLQKKNQFTPKSLICQARRIFGTRAYKNLQIHGDSDCFEMPKSKRAVQENIFLTRPVTNVRLSEKINVSSKVNLMSGLTLTPRKRPQSAPSNQEKERMTNGGKDWKCRQRGLSENDLMNKLAKKKKYDNPQNRTVPIIKTSYDNTNETTPVKKRVTFAMDFQKNDTDRTEYEQCDELIYEYEPARDDVQNVLMKALKRLAKPQTKTEPWYIVVDAKVLLEDFESIATFVQADTKCRLLIPSAVGNQIKGITVGECRGLQRVIAARRLARAFTSPPDYMTMQIGEERASGMSVSESIINCCLAAVDQNYHVVLLTNDTNLHKKAKTVDIPCIALQEIKDGASAPKPVVSFNMRKNIIINPEPDIMNNANGENNQRVAVSSTVNPFNMSSRSEIPVLSVQEPYVEQTVPETVFRKRLFNIQDLQNNDDENDKSEEINLNDAHEIPKTSADREIIQTIDIFASKNYRGIEKPIIAESIPEDEARAEVTVKMNKVNSINSYNIEQHLRKFVIKTKLVENRVRTRMDEWICSFSQIMEDILTYILILQDNLRARSTLTPPWTLAEVVECVRNLYGDHSSIKLIAERLSALLFACSSNKGQLNLDTKPNDFMTIFGLAILLIQCLQNVVPTQCELCEAEGALLSLLELVTNPGDEHTLGRLLCEPSVCTSNEPCERKNRVKKSEAEVIEYLRIHYPEWKTSQDQLNEKSKQPEPRKAGTERDYDEHFYSNDTQQAKNTCDEAIKTTGDKSTLNKVPTLQNIDVENRDEHLKELMSMIGSIIENTDEEADVNDGNTNTYQVCDKNQAKSDKQLEPRIVDTLGNFTIREANTQYNYNNNKTTSINDTPKENKSNTKHENPKTLKKISLGAPTKDESNKNLDLDALDYEIDYSEDENNDADATFKDIETNDPNKQADEESPQIFYRNSDKQNNENINTDTTENGFENEGLRDDLLAATCFTLTTLRKILMHVYNFLSRTFENMRDVCINEDAKVALHQKSSKGCKDLAKIIDGLKIIIARESDDRTCMKTALMEAGVAVVDDRIIEYKQVITRYLEQALILEEGMQLVVTATGVVLSAGDRHGTVSS